MSRCTNGVVNNINAYDEYGIPNATNAGRFQYTGQVWLPERGMYHYKARIYSPTLGRFLQTDPIGYEDDLNLYGYVANDPVNLTDPTGMQIACPLCDRITEKVKDVAEQAQGVVDHMWGTEESPGTARMTANWLTGQGPDNLEFGPDSPNTQELMAPQASQEREIFCTKSMTALHLMVAV